MGKRDALIGIYANDLRERCGIEPEMELLRKVTIGTGPAIYDPQAAVVDAADPADLDLVRRNFLVRKLGLRDGPDLADAVEAALDTYGRDAPRKYRAVLHYLLTKQLGRESVFL
ncbi:MAG: DUF2853 family protein [Tranquillimonas sp.]|jgi:hypothetical protein